jgi:3-deoxy-D-manno-octulosonate 8-phosphate phosphatase (KDO 8-P phosphatase)
VSGGNGTTGFPASLLERAARVRLLLTDVDGCWTDGGVTVHADGSESVHFHIHDGFGVVELLKTDVEIALISGRETEAVRHRARRLGVDLVHLGVRDKSVVAERLIRERGLTPEQVLAFGDDLPDLPLFERAGLRAAPPGALPAIRARADWITRAAGGAGALREICDLLLVARGAAARA